MESFLLYAINLGFMGETKPLTSDPKRVSFHNDIDCRSASERYLVKADVGAGKTTDKLPKSLDASF